MLNVKKAYKIITIIFTSSYAIDLNLYSNLSTSFLSIIICCRLYRKYVLPSLIPVIGSQVS